MERLSRFRRSKKDAATTTAATNGQETDSSGARTPSTSNAARVATTPPATAHNSAGGGGGIHLEPPNMQSKHKPQQLRKLSPFSRGFHSLRSSHKRSRDSPPASLPQSPTTTVSRPGTAVAMDGEKVVEAGRPKMPAFLELSEKDILEKFMELAWLERSRMAQSMSNPSPSFKWARVPSKAQIHILDRYVNIQPWHNNRVKLQVPEGQIDYINASPITLQPTVPKPDHEEEHRYIAMQGPKQVSTDHVWRMVVEQLESPGVIVMLTETHEANMEKCYQYFPRRKEDPPLEVNGRDEFGDGFYATVRCEGLEDTPAGDAIELRKLIVRVQHNRKKKQHQQVTTPTKGTSNGKLRNGSRRAAMDEDRGGTPGRVSTNTDDHADAFEKLKSPTADIREGLSQLPSSLEQAEANNIKDMPRSGSATPIEDSLQESIEVEKEEEQIEERTIYHFLYKKWPDFGVPALEDIDSFFTLMRLSREKNASPTNPRIVHCSAGVGRSGTFIALEHLVRELEAGVLENWDQMRKEAVLNNNNNNNIQKDTSSMEQQQQMETENPEEAETEHEEESEEDDTDDLIFNTVNALREQRKTMVQSESQYLFIYQVMKKLWTDKYVTSPTTRREGSGEPAPKRLEVDPFVEKQQQQNGQAQGQQAGGGV